MAMSARERKQKQLEREREVLGRLDDATYPFLKKPFFMHVDDDPNWTDIALSLELLGIEPPVFEDDRGPEHYASEGALPPNEDPADSFSGFKRSIGRAEVMVDYFLDVATVLSSIVNYYKLKELAERRREIEAADLSDPADRKAALADIEKIARLEAELNKNVRRTFPTWKVKAA